MPTNAPSACARGPIRTANLYAFAALSSDGRYVAAPHFGLEDRGAITLLDAASGAVVRSLVFEPETNPGWGFPVGDGGVFVSREYNSGVDLGGAFKELPELVGAWPLPHGFIVRDREKRLLRVDEHGDIARQVPFANAVNSVVAGPEGPGAVIYVASVATPACTLATLDATTLALESEVELDACVDQLARLADGRLVGKAVVSRDNDPRGDSEVVVIDTNTGTLTPLTADGFDVVSVRAAASRVAFTRELGPWPSGVDLGVYRRQVCWIDVPSAGAR